MLAQAAKHRHRDNEVEHNVPFQVHPLTYFSYSKIRELALCARPSLFQTFLVNGIFVGSSMDGTSESVLLQQD
jgi:hypothetical protein